MSHRAIAACAAALFACGGSSKPPGTIPTGCLANADCNDPSLVCCASASYTCVAAAQCPAASGSCPTAASIVAGGTINAPQPPANSCSKAPKDSSLPASQVQTFKAQKVGNLLNFNVPAGTGSLTLVEQAVSAIDAVVFKGQVIENSAVPLNVIAPDGTKLYDDNTCCDPDGGDPSGQYPVFFGGGGANTLALTMPNATLLLSSEYRDGGVGLPAGTWKMTVNDYAKECVSDPSCTDGGSPNGTYDVSVITKPGLPTTGALDVSLYLVSTTPGFDNTNAAQNGAIQRFVQTLSTFYAQVGVCVRTVKVFDVPTWAQNSYGSSISADKTDPCSALDQMFTLSQPGNAMNFFLVQSITAKVGSSGQQVVGIDGTIPGPATIGGTVHSGAAVSIADLGSIGCAGPISIKGCGPDSVAYIAAHEGGHYMGLFHTSEASGEFFDPLTDTPTCRCQTCVAATQVGSCNRDGTGTQVLPQNCRRPDGSCGGGDDLMFWIFDQSSAGHLSPQQGQVMRLNPVVQ